MANRAYLIPRRNDIDGKNMQVTDLWPNDSQRNYIYDPPAQAGYLKYPFDTPGATVVDGDAYVSGSLNTFPVAALVDDDTTGGGDDVAVPAVAQFGLLAYIQDRIQPGGAGNPASPAECLAMADAILALVEAGSDLTEALVNAALAGVVGGSSLTAGDSFGVLEEILQILTGYSYRLPAFTIIGLNGGGNFLGLVARQVLVAAQDVVANGGTTFVAAGSFVARGETGFRDIRTLVLSGPVRISRGEGVLAAYADATFEYINPGFSYAAGSLLPRARDIAGNVIPATGVHAVVAVYGDDGTLIT